MVALNLDLRNQAGHGEAVRSPLVARRLARYHPNYRSRVVALASSQSRLADLAVSFPALLFALTVPRFGIVPSRAIERTIAGAPLSEIASHAGVPMWLRRLPPEALEGPLPSMPDGALFRRQIVNHIPRSPKWCPMWLRAVSIAAEAGDEAFAVWLAREFSRLPRLPDELNVTGLRRMAVWAWFGSRRDTHAGSLVAIPWTIDMGWEAANRHARKWRDLVGLHVFLGDKPLDDMWFQPAVIDGFSFEPLTTAAEIAVEARRMDHCLVNYGNSIASGWARVWRIHRDGAPVATIEVGCPRGARGDGFIGVRQIKGLRNAAVGEDVKDVAARWQMAQDLTRAGRTPSEHLDVLGKRRIWVAMWRPYWLEKRRMPAWLPLVRNLDSLDCD